MDVRPLNGWFSVKFTCLYGSDSPQGTWADTLDYIAAAQLPLKKRKTPPGSYDANDLNGAARLAVFKIWSHIGNEYDMREKAESFDPNGITYTLSREIPDETYPWSENLVKTVVVLDGFMAGGGCVYERAPVLRDWFQDIIDGRSGS